jgi:AcrR family transcriptional regulator
VSDLTKSLILDNAERLFADLGFGATSLRQIIANAGVNLAAIHYHFGSREGLIKAVLSRRLEPLNQDRLERLARSEAVGELAVDTILEALIGPALRLSRDPQRGGEVFMRLLGRAYTEPNEKIQEMLWEQFREVVERFIHAFELALPRLPREEICWRLHFGIGAMAHTMGHPERLRCISRGLCDVSDTDRILRRLVRFLEAGMQLPMKEGKQA